MDAPSHPFMSSPMRPMMADVYSYHIGSYVGLDPQTGQLGVVETVTPLSGGGGVGYEEAGGGRGVSNGNTASSSIETSTGSSSTSTEQSSKASSDSVSKLRSQLDQIRSQLTTGTAQVKEAQSQSKRLREEIVKLRSTANTSAAEVKQFTAKMQQQREEIAAQNKKLTEESGQLAAKLKQSLAKAIADAGPGADTSAIEKKLAAEMMPLLENLETQMKNNNSLLDAQLSVLEKQQAAVQSTNKVTNAQLQKAEIDLKSAENRAEKLLQQNTLLSRRIQEMTREIEQRANRLTQR
jgi:chromosome segregation ATPase